MKVDFVPVKRAKAGLDSHITGIVADAPGSGVLPFPVIGDPSELPNFVQRIATDAGKAELLERLRAGGRAVVPEDMPGSATVH